MGKSDYVSICGYPVFTGSKEFFMNEFQGVVNTINPHAFVVALKDRTFSKALKEAEYLIPDGVGIKIAALILRGCLIKKIAGFDLHEVMLKSVSERKGSCFYLGSSDAVLKKIKERIASEYPSLRIATYSPPFRDNFSEAENFKMIDAINKFSPDVLFIGMTAPKQEKWLYEHKHMINAPVKCSIGAVFDFFSGTVKRPGRIWISMGLEWFPRLLHEPRRLWQRTLISAPVFFWHILSEKIRLLTNHM